MGETKHTPGPWRVYSIVIGGDPVHRVDGQRGEKPINWRPTLADAHLIAAAPDMLEALEKCVRILVDDFDYRPDDEAANEWADIRAAIKKARGEK